jgi:hypothetical protein
MTANFGNRIGAGESAATDFIRMSPFVYHRGSAALAATPAGSTGAHGVNRAGISVPFVISCSPGLQLRPMHNHSALAVSGGALRMGTIRAPKLVTRCWTGVRLDPIWSDCERSPLAALRQTDDHEIARSQSDISSAADGDRPRSQAVVTPLGGTTCRSATSSTSPDSFTSMGF